MPIQKQQENVTLLLVTHTFTSIVFLIRKVAKITMLEIIMGLHQKEVPFLSFNLISAS